jgi:hypothetical protein
MKKNFLKNIGKDALPRAGKSVLRSAGTVGTLALHKALTTPNKDGKVIIKDKAAKIMPWVYFVLGTLAEIMTPDKKFWPYAGALVGGGMATGGALLVTGQLLGDKRDKLGLAGIGAPASNMLPGTDASQLTSDWERALAETRALRESPSAIPSEEPSNDQMAGVYNTPPATFTLAGPSKAFSAVA